MTHIIIGPLGFDTVGVGEGEVTCGVVGDGGADEEVVGEATGEVVDVIGEVVIVAGVGDIAINAIIIATMTIKIPITNAIFFIKDYN